MHMEGYLILPRAYVIDQPYVGIMALDVGLKRGSIFPNIVFPEMLKEK